MSDESFISRLWHRMERPEGSGQPSFSLFRSGVATLLVLATVLLLFGVIWHQHERGRLHRYNKLADRPMQSDTVVPPHPGGQNMITLTRPAVLSAMTPEFVSMTLLPGVGMEPLQITANVPEHGPVQLLYGTDPKNADAAYTEGNLEGSPILVLSRPAGRRNAVQYNAGILANRPASRVQNDIMPDGGHASAEFYPIPPGTSAAAAGQEGVEVQVTSLLSGREVELTVTARNTSTAPREISIAWMCRFAAPGDGLGRLRLSIPTSERIAGNRVQSAHGTPDDFSAISGAPLNGAARDVSYVHLHREFLSVGPEVKLTDEQDRFVLHMAALTPSISMLHLATDPTHNTATIALGTAGAFPSGLEEDGVAPRVVAPGEQLEWKVRLELSAISSTPAGGQIAPMDR